MSFYGSKTAIFLTSIASSNKIDSWMSKSSSSKSNWPIKKKYTNKNGSKSFSSKKISRKNLKISITMTKSIPEKPSDPSHKSNSFSWSITKNASFPVFTWLTWVGAKFLMMDSRLWLPMVINVQIFEPLTFQITWLLTRDSRLWQRMVKSFWAYQWFVCPTIISRMKEFKLLH